MPLKGIEVGAWRLEAEADKLHVELGSRSHFKLLGLLPVLAEHGKPQGVLFDLVSRGPKPGGSSLFSIGPRAFEVEGTQDKIHTHSFELRFFQALRVGGRLMRLATILHSDDLTIHKSPALKGGRKLNVVDPNFLPEDGIPSYRTQGDLLADLEDLSPVTDRGIERKLDEMGDYYGEVALRQRAKQDFEETAEELALTI